MQTQKQGGKKEAGSSKHHRACPTNGSDCGSLRDHNLTLLVRHGIAKKYQFFYGLIHSLADKDL